MSAKEGINKFGDRSVTAMLREYKKIDKGTVEGKPVTTPIDTDMLYYKDKRKAIEAVNLIKENRNGKIKVRKYADGNNKKVT